LLATLYKSTSLSFNLFNFAPTKKERKKERKKEERERERESCMPAKMFENP
jgi:hypothetical protein